MNSRFPGTLPIPFVPFLIFLTFLVTFLGAPVHVVLAAEEFRFSADSTSIRLAEGEERTVLSGNARIVSEDTVISAQEIEIYGDDFRYAVCRGTVSAEDSEQGIALTADRLFFDREADLLRAEGEVEMEDTENDVMVRGGILENRGDTKVTIVQVGVRMFGEKFTARSEFARYRREENVVELSGLPIVFWQDDRYEATRIVVNLDTDDITLEGEVRGSIVTEEEEGDGEGAPDGQEAQDGQEVQDGQESQNGQEAQNGQPREGASDGEQ